VGWFGFGSVVYWGSREGIGLIGIPGEKVVGVFIAFD
jgi:hypothetical protein